MNIGEATDVYTVLRYLLHDPKVPADKAKEAAARLADRAHKALSAGPTGDQILARWRRS